MSTLENTPVATVARIAPAIMTSASVKKRCLRRPVDRSGMAWKAVAWFIVVGSVIIRLSGRLYCVSSSCPLLSAYVDYRQLGKEQKLCQDEIGG